MKVVDILNKKHTVLSSVDGIYHHQGLIDINQTILDMKSILFNLGKRYSNKIEELRKMEYHSNEQLIYKSRFPTWFVGGTFPFNKTKDKDIVTYSNILAIDIDKVDNPNIDLNNIRKTIFELPYVFAVLKSISGEGYYALILVEDGKYTKEYYEYLALLWNKKFGINIDEKCTNIGRKRFLSYEEDIKDWIKSDDTDIKEWKLKLIKEEPKFEQPRIIDYRPMQINNNEELTRKAIWYLLNDGYSIDNIKTDKAYSVWYHIGCDFRHFDDGEQMFIQFSNNTSKYKDSINKILSKWKQTNIETPIDDVCRKWCGICKNKYGKYWISIINQQILF